MPSIPELQNVKILDSWYWSAEELRIELEEARAKVNEINRKLRLLEKERKLQPKIQGVSHFTKIKYVVTRYQITDLEQGMICAEAKEEIETD